MCKLRVTCLLAAAQAIRSTWVTHWHMTFLDGSSDGFEVLFTGYVRVKFGSIVHDGVRLTHAGHPAAPYPSLGSGSSRPINFGRPAGLSSMEILQVGPSKPFLGRWRLNLGVRVEKL